MYPAGYAAVCAGRILGVPSVVGVGEGEFWTLEAVGERRAARELAAATAFLANSTCIAENLTKTLAIPPEKIRVFPNGVALDRFQRCADREAQCRLLGLPSAAFTIGFIGPPVAQKGYPQLREAVAGMEETRLILLGRGMAVTDDPQVAYAGAVSHADVPRYLGACDIFVLPTAIEGSCNAVIEAMACGLPIITSNGRHMDDIVDDDVAMRVDPTDVGAIRTAILTLKNDSARRRRMSEACLRKAKQFDINERARHVTAWMKELVRMHRA
jgi:glycosyltransferase involved in cell wall biosynthesis